MNAELEEAANAIARSITADADEGRRDARMFLHTLGRMELGELAVSDAERAELIERTTEPVGRAVVPLGSSLSAFESWLIGHEYYGDDWSFACRQRSEIQFLRDIYLPRIDEDPESWMDPGEVDYMMQHAAQLEGGLSADRIPPRVPTSHFWWWLPDAPPATR